MGAIIPKLRASARGQTCTFMLDGCGYDDGTIVLCHCRVNYLGMAAKPPDYFSAFGCSSCHEKIDAHRLDAADEYKAWLCAIKRTQQTWFDSGLMTFPTTATRARQSDKIVPHDGRMRR
jgi:hypothetical protein